MDEFLEECFKEGSLVRKTTIEVLTELELRNEPRGLCGAGLVLPDPVHVPVGGRAGAERAQRLGPHGADGRGAARPHRDRHADPADR